MAEPTATAADSDAEEASPATRDVATCPGEKRGGYVYLVGEGGLILTMLLVASSNGGCNQGPAKKGAPSQRPRSSPPRRRASLPRT